MVNAFQFGQYAVTRADNGRINITTGTQGRRGGVETDIDFAPSQTAQDTFEIRGEKDREPFNWDIQLSPNGISASPAGNPGRRGRISDDAQVTSFAQNVSLQPEQYESAALAAASGIVGVPLSLFALPA